MRWKCWAFAICMSVQWLAASAALACPVCDTDTGQQVRAGIFDEDFARNLLLTLLPFPVLLTIVAAIHFGLPGRAARQNREKHAR